MKKTVALLLAVLTILCGGFTASASENGIAYSKPLTPFTVGASGLSTLEKVIYINEYLTTNYVYDYNVNNTNAIHDSYGFLYENRGVCQAYALTFLGLI